MYIHEKIMLCALELKALHQLTTVELVGELCQAGHVLSAFTDEGLESLRDGLHVKALAELGR